MGLLDPCSDLVVDFVESAPQGAGELGEIGEDSAQAGAQDTVIDSGEEQGGAQAKVRESVAMRAWDALNNLVEAESAQVIGHLAGGEGVRRYSEEGREAVAQEAVGKPSGKLWKRQQGVAQGLDLGIGAAPTRVAGPLGGGDVIAERPLRRGCRRG